MVSLEDAARGLFGSCVLRVWPDYHMDVHRNEVKAVFLHVLLNEKVQCAGMVHQNKNPDNSEPRCQKLLHLGSAFISRGYLGGVIYKGLTDEQTD